MLNRATNVMSIFYMKKYLTLLLLLGMGSAVHAGGLSTRHQSSLQLTVDAARTTSTRVGNSYSISGNNVNTTHAISDGSGGTTTTYGGIGVNTYSSGVATPGSITGVQSNCSGSGASTSCSGAFSFSQAFTAGDSLTTATDQTVYTAGVAGTGAPGTINDSHDIVITGGTVGAGAGTQVTAQFVTEITAF